MAMMRAFVAVPVGHQVVQAAARMSALLRERLLAMGHSAKWVPPANMHVTVRFLGNIDEVQVPAVVESLGPIVRRHTSFVVTLRGLGCFPDARRPAVLWVGITEGKVELEELATEVNETLDGLGFPEQDRPFHPHLTLARIPRGGRPPDLSALVAEHATSELGSTPVRELVLFRSMLRPKGPLYEPIWRGSLNPGGSPGG